MYKLSLPPSLAIEDGVLLRPAALQDDGEGAEGALLQVVEAGSLDLGQLTKKCREC